MRTRPWDPSNGLPWETVVVRGIDLTTGMADCENHIGKMRRVPMSVQRARGALPAVGERWAIDKTLGDWTFAAVLNPRAAVVAGNQSGGDGLTAFLNALDQMGLIENNTVAVAPTGGTGGTGTAYVHNQEVPASHWVVTHNLNYRPGGVVVMDTSSNRIEGDFTYVSATLLYIDFSAAFAGVAYLS